jgi:hypothetical protein
MDNELIRRIARRVFEKSSNINNYIMLEGLIRRFIELNPDADPETIDWSAIWDDTLSYEELIQAFKEQYPMYRWDDKRPSDETYSGDRVKDIASEIATRLDAEDFDKLIAELQRIKEEILEDVRRVEEEQTERQQIIVPAQPREKPTGVGIKPSLHLLAKYPFLSSAAPLLRAYHITHLPQEVRSRAVERVLEAIERGEKGVLPKLDNPWVELLSFPLSRALVLYVEDDWLRKRWALAEAARVERGKRRGPAIRNQRPRLTSQDRGRQVDNALQPIPAPFEEAWNRTQMEAGEQADGQRLGIPHTARDNQAG